MVRSLLAMYFFFFFLLSRRPRRSPLFPYPPLFRSRAPRPRPRRRHRRASRGDDVASRVKQEDDGAEPVAFGGLRRIAQEGADDEIAPGPFVLECDQLERDARLSARAPVVRGARG